MSHDTTMHTDRNGKTGAYLMQSMSLAELAERARDFQIAPGELKVLKERLVARRLWHYAPVAGVDAADLAQAGWALVFPAAEPGSARAAEQQAICEALRPLLDRRREQASGATPRYRVVDGADGYRPGESKDAFLLRMGKGPGPVDPRRLPYYLLLVGAPAEIPFAVQSQLDIQYAVGRIHFAGIHQYEHYARNIVAAETGQAARERKAVFFGVANPGDRATELSARHLIEPLAAHLQGQESLQGWQIEAILRDDATKARLRASLGESRAALVFAAAHGIGFPAGHEQQRRDQGALVCQDWNGLHGAPPTPEQYFAGSDVAGDLHGLVAFLFACYGLGTPEHDEYLDYDRSIGRTERPPRLAPEPFLASLAQEMLGREQGALAVIGHIGRSWDRSFVWGDRSRGEQMLIHRAVYESVLTRLLGGARVGLAMDEMSLRYAEIASDLVMLLERRKQDASAATDEELAYRWMCMHDARNYAVLGDPAVRIHAPR